MIDHMGVSAADFARSRAFYHHALGALGLSARAVWIVLGKPYCVW